MEYGIHNDARLGDAGRSEGGRPFLAWWTNSVVATLVVGMSLVMLLQNL